MGFCVIPPPPSCVVLPPSFVVLVVVESAGVVVVVGGVDMCTVSAALLVEGANTGVGSSHLWCVGKGEGETRG